MTKFKYMIDVKATCPTCKKRFICKAYYRNEPPNAEWRKIIQMMRRSPCTDCNMKKWKKAGVI